MRKYTSPSSALLVTAMIATLSFGCGEGVKSETSGQSAQLTNGQCNRIVARTLGLTQRCNNFGCSLDECAELQATFTEFFELTDCGDAFFAGELNGLAGSALSRPNGEPKHIQEVICGAAEACDPTCEGIKAVGLCLDTEACSTVYAQDFESLDRQSPTALSDDGWLVFGQVFDGTGVFKFNYGPFPAPNGGPGFSAIITGEGGPDQGAQQLVVYNDYNCCDPPNQGHFNGTDRVQSSVFQSNPISANDVGKTLTFSFDAKRGNINESSTAVAFIQTIDPDAGLQTNFVTIDMTNLPPGTWDRYSISLAIDEGLVDQLREFGFFSTASNFEPSGVLYDNILVELKAP